jgi:hypothetical protein
MSDDSKTYPFHHAISNLHALFIAAIAAGGRP